MIHLLKQKRVPDMENKRCSFCYNNLKPFTQLMRLCLNRYFHLSTFPPIHVTSLFDSCRKFHLKPATSDELRALSIYSSFTHPSLAAKLSKKYRFIWWLREVGKNYLMQMKPENVTSWIRNKQKLKLPIGSIMCFEINCMIHCNILAFFSGIACINM